MTNFPDDAMDPNKHPDDAVIHEYLETPDAAGFSELRLHLAGCSHCRRRTEVSALLLARGEWLQSEPVADDAELDDLVAGRLDADRAKRLRREIQQDPARLRAALHRVSHVQAMQDIEAEAPRPHSALGRGLDLIRAWLVFEAPLWKMAPVMAVLFGLLWVLAGQLTLPQNEAQIEIIAFSDNQSLRFVSQESQPGIGFFSQPNSIAEPFAGLSIEILDQRRLRFAWPAIDRASDYNLKLQVFRDGETRVLARYRGRANSAVLKLDEALTQHRYEWVLSGDTDDERSFQTGGGFVVSVD